MAEIGHAYNSSEVNESNNTTSWQNISASRIVAASVSASTDHILLVGALVGGSNSNDNSFEFRTTEAATEITGSFAKIEPRRTGVGLGHPYMFMDRLTTPASANYQMQLRVSGGTNSAQVARSELMMFSLADLASSDYAWNEDLTAYSSIDNAAWTDGASVSIGDGSSNYTVIYFAHVLVNNIADAIRLRLDIGGTTYDYIDLEAEDTSEEYCIGGMAIVSAPAVSTLAKIQFQTDSATPGQMDIDINRVFALRMNAFEDHAVARNATDTPITAAATDTVALTMNKTVSTAASRDWAVLGFAINDVGESVKRTTARVQDSALGLFAGVTAEPFVQNGATDQTPLFIIGQAAGVADATSLSAEYIVQETNDVNPNPSIIDAHLAMFTWELAAAASAAVSGVGSASSLIGVIAGTGERVIVGNSSATAALATIAGSGERVIVGNGSAAAIAAIVSATAERIITATGSASPSIVVFSASGTVGGAAGDFIVAVPVQTTINDDPIGKSVNVQGL